MVILYKSFSQGFQLPLPVCFLLPSSSSHSLTLDSMVSVARMLAISVEGPPYVQICRADHFVMDLDVGSGRNPSVMRSCGFLMSQPWTSGHQPRPYQHINVVL